MFQKIIRNHKLRERGQGQHQTYALGIKEVFDIRQTTSVSKCLVLSFDGTNFIPHNEHMILYMNCASSRALLHEQYGIYAVVMFFNRTLIIYIYVIFTNLCFIHSMFFQELHCSICILVFWIVTYELSLSKLSHPFSLTTSR